MDLSCSYRTKKELEFIPDENKILNKFPDYKEF